MEQRVKARVGRGIYTGITHEAFKWAGLYTQNASHFKAHVDEPENWGAQLASAFDYLHRNRRLRVPEDWRQAIPKPGFLPCGKNQIRVFVRKMGRENP